jgi:hypothetical protein
MSSLHRPRLRERWNFVADPRQAGALIAAQAA